MNKVSCCKADYVVCTCMGVMKQEIIEAIEGGNDTYKGLQEAFGVGTGCSSCVPEVREILKNSLKNEENEKNGKIKLKSL